MSEAEWDTWDKQIEEDVKSGRLDNLLREVKDAYGQGFTLPICEGKRRFYQTHSTNKLNK